MTNKEQKTFIQFTDECINKIAPNLNLTPHQVRVACVHNKKVSEEVFTFVTKKWNVWKAKEIRKGV